MATTEMVRRSLDLTRAPNEQWNEEMIQVVTKNVFRGKDITQAQLYYCLNVAESLALNPLIGEIYFLPAKSKDGSGPAWAPYIGRNGLVKKAAERNAYFESDTVHANDKFTIRRGRDGEVHVTHSYGAAERGEIVGAYAFLHFRNGDKPAFFYAKLEEYLPEFDHDWKMKVSPWGNQRSAMIEKCAMIGAGRKRLDLGNAMIDAEGAIVEQMNEGGPRSSRPQLPAEEIDFSQYTEDAELAERLRVVTGAARWQEAKIEMLLAGRSHEELRELADRAEAEAANLAASAAPAGAESTPEPPEGERTTDPDVPVEDVTDAEVVDLDEHAEALRLRVAGLEQRLEGCAPETDEFRDLSDELEGVQAELDACTDPGQTSLGL